MIYWITIERVNLQYSRLTTDYCVYTDGKFFSGMVLMYYYGCMNLYLASGSRQCKHGSLRRSVSLFIAWATYFKVYRYVIYVMYENPQGAAG